MDGARNMCTTAGTIVVRVRRVELRVYDPRNDQWS